MKMCVGIITNLLVWIFVCSLGARSSMPDTRVNFTGSNTGLKIQSNTNPYQSSDLAWVDTVVVDKLLSDSFFASDSALRTDLPLLGNMGDIQVLMLTNKDKQYNPYRSYQSIKKLANSGELTLFSSLYLPFRPQQMLLLKQYLKKPDTLHLKFLKMAWDEFFPAEMINALLQQQVARPGIWDDKQFFCLPNFIEEEDQLKPISAVVLNGFFPNEGEIPKSIRPQVESIRALVSIALFDPFNSGTSFEETVIINPSFSTYYTLTRFLDSYDSLRVVYENWLDPSQLSDFNLFAKHLIKSRLQDNTLISVFEKRVETAHQISMAKGKTILLIPGFEQCISRAKFNKKLSPSMLDEIFMAGVAVDSIARYFTLFGTEELPPYLVVTPPDSISHKQGRDSGISKQIAQDSLVSLYTCLDSLPIKTRVLFGKMQESTSIDDDLSMYEETQPTHKLSGRFATTPLASDKSMAEISYIHLLGLCKSNSINTLLKANGIAEIPQMNGRGIFQSQGISMAIQKRNTAFLSTNRVIIAQSNTIDNVNLSGFYALYYKTLGIELGEFLQIEFGGLLGFVQHKVKRFSGLNGGFINQDQPSIIVKNPACISGISVSPSLHLGWIKMPQYLPQTRHLFLRVTVGYARDMGSPSWLFKGNKLYSPGDFKSTGWYNSAEFGYAVILNSKKKSAEDLFSQAQKNR